jgi:alkanesulfonate monooxygenase SsuD/methylene tetrahydromethanopterin reductase-like flavin-dependent oxidoreductase (luciferase family)
MSALAGKVAHGVLLNPTLSRRHLEEVAIPAVLAGAEGRREEVTLAALVTCAPDDDDERALRAAASGIVAQLGRGYFMDSWRLDGFGDAIDEAAARAAAGDTAGAFAEIPPDLVRLVAAAGTPEACARRIEELLRVLDVVVLVPPTFMADEAEWARRAESVLALASAAG